jgi:hypothetical protein
MELLYDSINIAIEDWKPSNFACVLARWDQAERHCTIYSCYLQEKVLHGSQGPKEEFWIRNLNFSRGTSPNFTCQSSMHFGHDLLEAHKWWKVLLASPMQCTLRRRPPTWSWWRGKLPLLPPSGMQFFCLVDSTKPCVDADWLAQWRIHIYVKGCTRHRLKTDFFVQKQFSPHVHP